LRLALATVHPRRTDLASVGTRSGPLRQRQRWNNLDNHQPRPHQLLSRRPLLGWANRSSRSPTGAACSVSTSPVVVNCMQRHDPTVRPHHLLDSAPAPPT